MNGHSPGKVVDSPPDYVVVERCREASLKATPKGDLLVPVERRQGIPVPLLVFASRRFMRLDTDPNAVTVTVVDDEPIAQDVLIRAARSWHYHCQSASSAAQSGVDSNYIGLSKGSPSLLALAATQT